MILHHKIKKLLKFCPVCGKELEEHPFSGRKVCFVHGDFVIDQTTNERGVRDISFEMMPTTLERGMHRDR